MTTTGRTRLGCVRYFSSRLVAGLYSRADSAPSPDEGQHCATTPSSLLLILGEAVLAGGDDGRLRLVDCGRAVLADPRLRFCPNRRAAEDRRCRDRFVAKAIVIPGVELSRSDRPRRRSQTACRARSRLPAPACSWLLAVGSA